MAGALKQAVLEGLADATGFFAGALAGWLIGRALGCDVLAPGGSTSRTLIGWLLLLAGCGAGKWAAQRVKARLAGRPR
ncbi:MAG: hypothetical protein CFE45_31460 [Burkholderiales bacterium PBB5]|nr:MAG: hypothetical protein CFE45_31460 [Burkholderiales bacterium PBB5]